MYLTFRETRPEDLPRCFEITFENFLFNTPQLRDELLAFWGKILAERSAISAVTENHEKPEGKKIVAFGLSLFVTDSFFEEASTNLSPGLALQILQKARLGKPVHLDRKALARDNAGNGLNIAVIHFGVERPEGDPGQMNVNHKMVEAFHLFHGGYFVKRMLHEGYFPEERQIYQAMGHHLVRDYVECAPKTPALKDRSVTLWGTYRDKGPNKMSYMAPLFLYPKPRFAFSSGEQDNLEKALLGESDQDIAESLELSVWAVKKRWQGIYEKVDKADPALLAGTPEQEDDTDKIPKNRRRVLLNYLRAHLEELRPYDPVAASK